MRIFSILFILFLGLSATPVLAQFSTQSFIDPVSGIELKPEYPQPGEKITAAIADYSNGSYGAAITWSLNGEIIPEAENQRTVVFTAGKAGEPQTIRAVLDKTSGGNMTLSKTVSPAFLDIIIEPQTRTPEFYLGRSLPSIGSIVNATALVSVDKIQNSPDLIYTWRIGQQVIEGGPIRGRNQVSFSTPRGTNEVLAVQVSRLDGTVVSQRSILLPSVSPEVHFYEVSSLFGINKKAVDKNVSILGNSIVLRAEPYYLDSRAYNNPSIIQWKLANSSIDNPSSNPYEITLQRVGVSGSTELMFHVRDTEQLLQGAQGATHINF